jgi:hypothetical protein
LPSISAIRRSAGNSPNQHFSDIEVVSRVSQEFPMPASLVRPVPATASNDNAGQRPSPPPALIGIIELLAEHCAVSARAANDNRS